MPAKKPEIEKIKVADLREKVKALREKNFHLVALIPWEKKGLQLIYFFSLPGREKLLAIDLNPKKPALESIVDIYPSANTYELEQKELFGIDFKNNPNIKQRLFLAEGFKKKSPLRKSFKEGKFNA